MTTTKQPSKKVKTDVDVLMEKAEVFNQMSTVQQADLVHKLKAKDMNQQTISKVVGVTPAQVSNLLLIHGMSKNFKKLIEDGIISGTLVLDVARQFKDEDSAKIEEMFNQVIESKKQAIKAHKGLTGEGMELKVTRKDFNRFQKVYNSISEWKKWVKKHPQSKVKQNHALYEYTLGLLSGKFNADAFDRLFGIKVA